MKRQVRWGRNPEESRPWHMKLRDKSVYQLVNTSIKKDTFPTAPSPITTHLTVLTSIAPGIFVVFLAQYRASPSSHTTNLSRPQNKADWSATAATSLNGHVIPQ